MTDFNIKLSDAPQMIEELNVAAYEENICTQLARVENGFWPFGKYFNTRFEHTELDYVRWFLNKTGRVRNPALDSRVIEAILIKLKTIFPKLTTLPVPSGNSFGVPGQKNGRSWVTFISKRYTDTKFGGMHIFKFVADSGELLITKGQVPTSIVDSQLILTPGDRIEIEFRIKEFHQFRDETGTRITHLKVMQTENDSKLTNE